MNRTKVLIVEDESIVSLNIKRILAVNNYDVMGIVTSGENAIDLVKSDLPDIILMDIQLSGELDGITTYELIKEIYDIPIIYSTAHSDEITLNRAKKTEPHGFIIKPINKNDLVTGIEIALYKWGIEQKLKTNEFFLKEAQRITKVGHYLLDFATGLWTSSEELDNIFSIDDSFERTVPAWGELIHPDHRDDMLRYFEEEVLGKGEAFNREYKIVGINSGETKWVHGTGIIDFDNDGKPVKMMGTIQDITRRKSTENELRESLERERLQSDIIRDASIAIGIGYPDGRLGTVNTAFEKLTGYSSEELLSINWNIDLTPAEWREVQDKKLEELHTEKKSVRFEKEYIRKDGTKLPVELVVHSRLDSKGDVECYFTFITDITDRKETEDQIKASLKEKEILLLEIHHRVKNNMQLISSLINLGMLNAEYKGDLELFKDLDRRILSLGLIHEKLYQSKNLSEIDFGEYIRSLSEEISSSHMRNRDNIVMKFNIGKITLDIDRAIPCGIIVNELVTNSYKHAFMNNKSGVLEISFNEDKKGNYELIVNDNGKGLPDDFDINNINSLGLQLVNGLVDQIDGEIEFENKKGARVKISFPHK